MTKRYFITGLLVLVPLVITLWVLSGLIGLMDRSLLLLPEAWRPLAQTGYDIPGIGALLTLLIVFVTGVVATNFFGRQIILFWEALLARVPVVKSIYYSVKQVSDTLFSDSGNAFRKALLVQFPHPGSWTIAFMTGYPGGDVVNHLQGDFISVYVPTTPNPTGGYFLMIAKEDVIELDMSVDEALKYIISMGVVAPRAVAAPVAVRRGAVLPKETASKTAAAKTSAAPKRRVAKPAAKPKTKNPSNP